MSAHPPIPAAFNQKLRLLIAYGLHMRPAAQVAERANGYPHSMLLCHNGYGVDARSIIDIMLLAAVKGTKLTLRVGKDKPGYEGAAKAMQALFDSGFGELAAKGR